MRMYTEDETIIREGVVYMGVAVPAFFFHGLSQASTIILRSIKKVKLPLYTSIGAFLLNIAGNYIFIFGKCGLPMLGIAGASLSTLLVRVFECAMNFDYLVLVEKEVKFRIPHLFMKTGELLPEYIRISVPVLISDGMMACGNNVVMMIVGRLGAGFVAANAIVSVVERLCTAFSGGVSHAGAVITGNTLGEGKKNRCYSKVLLFWGLDFSWGSSQRL